jgi:hypothetical protein
VHRLAGERLGDLDPPVGAQLRHLAGVERAENRGVERTEVFLLELRAADVLAVERDVLRDRLVKLLCRQRARVATDDTSANQCGFFLAMSSMALAWLRPRGVVMNAAQPLFSSTIGRW